MEIFNWYKKVVFDNYANFNGRARRSEYWYFVLFNISFAMLAYFIDNFLGLILDEGTSGLFYLILLLGTFLPALAVTIRRLHDADKSGWFILIWFVPMIGPFWFIIVLASEGTSGKNMFGEDPKRLFDEINEIGLE